MTASGAGGRQGLDVPVSDTVTAPTLIADEACEADMQLEQLSALSHRFTMERNGMGPKRALASLSLLASCFTSFLCSLMSLSIFLPGAQSKLLSSVE